MSETLTRTASPERLLELPRCLTEHPGFAEVIAALSAGGSAAIDGAWGSACALAAAALAEHAPGPIVVVCPRQKDLDGLVDDLALFTAAGVEVFPAWENEPGERTLHDDIYGDRLRTLKRLQSGEVKLVAAPMQALMQPTPAPQSVLQNTRLIRVGDTIEIDALLRWLVEHGFHSTTAVAMPGEFSRRGGILDIFAPDWYAPARLEFWGEELESIRVFDHLTQRSLETLDGVDITILAGGAQADGQLADFLPQQAWFLLLDPDQIAEEGKQLLRRVEHPQQYYTVAEVLGRIASFGCVTAAALARGGEAATARLQIESVERFSGDIAKVRGELEAAGAGQELYVVCQTEGEVRRLEEIFRETQPAAEGRLHFPVGRLTAGFRLAPQQIVLVSGAEMFHRQDVARPSRKRMGKAIDSFVDLREGDLVVHLAHGIGRYRGLKLINKDGQIEEHLELEFRDRVKIFVPATKIGLVQKYVGGRRARPQLAKIGGKSWVRHKQAALEAVNDLASEMLDVQAQRQARPGIAFGADTDWQREFDGLFPYHETPDQLHAVAAIKGDMQQPRPMDRLLCGDVGYGKTEIAIRAAFKAVDNGYQVAVLVPTTVLAEQHFRTFSSRMAEFPCHVAKLSRFSTPAQQRATVAGLRDGSVDVVIGTHRLASSDVGFENLGLVVIDEEQRFGVGVKERLKTLRSTVDVLTMTATPIPRTLHMSLVGLRDICNLETPPEDRIAVETKVARRDEQLVRHAVMRELAREGQVYFVHNRVHDIEVVARWLQRVVPEASIRIGHGQMNEHELEAVMVDFIAGKFDILLATTIVESGLDIPNANTIFIDDADRYGLADLHQLRGRVGRYKHRAYCYLLLDPDKNLTPNASRRLHAIEEFSQMGAGFALSMRDLEIRGAGNLLGSQQSGHIAAVGYEYYCEMMGGGRPPAEEAAAQALHRRDGRSARRGALPAGVRR